MVSHPRRAGGTATSTTGFTFALIPNCFLFTCYHGKQRAGKDSCLRVSLRRQFPQNSLFKHWQQSLFSFWVHIYRRVTSPEQPDCISTSAGWASRSSHHFTRGTKYPWASKDKEGEGYGHWGSQLPKHWCCSLWREAEGPCETWAPGPHVGGVSNPVASLCALSLEKHKCLQSSGTKEGRKDRGGSLRLCASAAAESTLKEVGMRQEWRELRCLQSSQQLISKDPRSVPSQKNNQAAQGADN